MRNLWGQFWPWPTWGPHLQLRWDQTLFAAYFSYCYLQSYIETELICLHINTNFVVFDIFLARQITYLVRNLWGQFWPWPTWGLHLQLRWDQTLWRGIGHPWSGIEHRWAFGWSYTRSLVWRVAIVFALFQVSCENTKRKNTVCLIRNYSKYTLVCLFVCFKGGMDIRTCPDSPLCLTNVSVLIQNTQWTKLINRLLN